VWKKLMAGDWGVCLLAMNAVFAYFYYGLALRSGLPYYRWALAGLVLGPVLWPLFTMKKRFAIYRLHGVAGQVLKA
jgi:hypothetical protein